MHLHIGLGLQLALRRGGESASTFSFPYKEASSSLKEAKQRPSCLLGLKSTPVAGAREHGRGIQGDMAEY